jgi:hypothetical protein
MNTSSTLVYNTHIPYVLASIRFEVEVPSNPWPLLLLLSLPSSHLGARSHLYSFFFQPVLIVFATHTDDTFQIQDWLRSNGNHDRGYPEFDYHHRIRPLSPVKRYRISTTDGRVPDRRRQLKSMESLLGLSDENLNGKHLVRDVQKYNFCNICITCIQIRF